MQQGFPKIDHLVCLAINFVTRWNKSECSREIRVWKFVIGYSNGIVLFRLEIILLIVRLNVVNVVRSVALYDTINVRRRLSGLVGPVESYYRAFGYRDLDTSRWNTMENVVTRFDVTFNSYLTLNRISFLSAIGSALRRFRLRVICLEANARLSFFSNLFFLFPFFQNRNPRRLIDSSFFFFFVFLAELIGVPEKRRKWRRLE